LDHSDIEVNIPNNNGKTALMCAVRNGKVNVVKILLDHSDIDVNIPDNNGKTALILAIQHNYRFVGIDIITELLKRDNLYIEHTDNSNKTALMWAQETGRRNIIELLKLYGNSLHYDIQ